MPIPHSLPYRSFTDGGSLQLPFCAYSLIFNGFLHYNTPTRLLSIPARGFFSLFPRRVSTLIFCLPQQKID